MSVNEDKYSVICSGLSLMASECNFVLMVL